MGWWGYSSAEYGIIYIRLQEVKDVDMSETDVASKRILGEILPSGGWTQFIELIF